MIRFLLFFIMLSSSFAVNSEVNIDLSDPEFMDVADEYPGYERLQLFSFSDTRGTTYENSSYFALLKDGDSGYWDVVLRVEIAFNKDDQQRLYIVLNTSCNDVDYLGNMNLKTNGKNVRYSKFCNGEKYYITPKSGAGRSYVVNEFKKRESVVVHFDDGRVIFDAAGFTKAWNNFGGDAL